MMFVPFHCMAYVFWNFVMSSVFKYDKTQCIKWWNLVQKKKIDNKLELISMFCHEKVLL